MTSENKAFINCPATAAETRSCINCVTSSLTPQVKTPTDARRSCQVLPNERGDINDIGEIAFYREHAPCCFNQGCKKILRGLLIALAVMAASPAQFRGAGNGGIARTDDEGVNTTDHGGGKERERASLQPCNSARPRDIKLPETEKSTIERLGPTLYHFSAHMNNKALAPTPLIWKSQAVATAIFLKMGIQLTWGFDARKSASKTVTVCEGESPASTLAVEIIPQAPANVTHNALAVTTRSANSAVSIAIFYDRMVPVLREHRVHDAAILGYVLAHEIGHVLQGISRHSAIGAMRTCWTEADFTEMSAGQLAFTAEDVRLIRGYFVPDQLRARSGASSYDASHSVASGGTQGPPGFRCGEPPGHLKEQNVRKGERLHHAAQLSAGK